MTKKKPTTFKIKKLQGKKRNGLHIKIENKYYKYNGNPTEIDAIIKYHNSNKKIPLTTIKKSYKEASKHLTTRLPKKTSPYTKKIKQELKKRKIHEHYKSGISNTHITDITNKTKTQLQQHTKKLLSKLVLDQQLLEILNQEHNLQKIKSRFQITITHQENNKELARSEIYNKTPQEVLQELQQKLKKGMIISYKTLKNQLPNYQHNKKEEGTLTHNNMTITLRKGK